MNLQMIVGLAVPLLLLVLAGFVVVIIVRDGKRRQKIREHDKVIDAYLDECPDLASLDDEESP